MRPRRGDPGVVGRIARGLRSFWAQATGSALPPWDDYYYGRPGWGSAAGMDVTPESAMQLAAVFSCVRVRSESFATCPAILYKRLPNGGKVRAPEHPLYHVLHNSPNQWQTSFEFFEMMQSHLDLRGNAFARIVPGPRGAIDQLIPLHPDLVQVYRLPNGNLKYQVRNRFTAEVDWYMAEEIFHMRGLSSDGLVGLSPIAVQRETIGQGLGMQDHQSRLIANDASTSTVLEHPGKFKDDAARQKFAENWQKARTGANRHKTAVLEDGMKLHQVGMTNKDAQFLELTGANAVDICGIFRMPPHKIQILTRATNNNIEHQGIEFVTDTMQGIATRWERRMNVELIDPVSAALGDDEYFVEFPVWGLVRGGMKDRFDAYAVGRNWGFLNPNKICEMEGWNPIDPEDGGDEYLRPLNMVPAGTIYVPPMATVEPNPDDKGAPGDEDPGKTPPPDTPDDEGEDADKSSARARLRMFAMDAAGRVVRKEVTALRKSLARAGAKFDAAAFAAEARDFYAGHQALTAETMRIPADKANQYVTVNLKLIIGAETPAEKSCVLDWIEDTAPESLAELALGPKRPAMASARS